MFIQVFSIPENTMAFKYKKKKLNKMADEGLIDIFFFPPLSLYLLSLQSG